MCPITYNTICSILCTICYAQYRRHITIKIFYTYIILYSTLRTILCINFYAQYPKHNMPSTIREFQYSKHNIPSTNTNKISYAQYAMHRALRTIFCTYSMHNTLCIIL